ncbi:pyridoxal phosphate-dependent aminotransferase [Periweissella cryptocerci]|uniref:Aminotransferase n=1 Tax=Periweissella cryptocerci TaxID=2506420 RepID=A0A4P6YUL9_9LACO|nr:pyridoxal phosphate-dependent aminotransferase [Periweissella cryptocerci]QBO36442.1 pyridoxal phosphate-dependent aminotransferase [Periweissella cryptocerci]
MKFSERVLNVTPSATLQVSALAKQMQADGIDVINLSTGEPDFATPLNIQTAAIASITDGRASYYTPVSGLPALKTAIINRVEADTGRLVEPNQVTVTVGAKMGLYSLFQAVLEPGDAAMVIAPYWVSYEEQLKLSGATVQIVQPAAPDLKVTVTELEAAKTDATRLLILNSPQNPAGLVYEAAELKAIAQWALDNDVLLVADEIYGKLVYNGTKFTSVLEFSDEIFANTVLIDGVSKAYAMTGWRLGYVVAQKEIISKINLLLGHMTSNPTTAAQYAAIEALSGDQVPVAKMREAFETRLNTTYALLEAVEGVKLSFKPQGAFYFFPDVTEAMVKLGYMNTVEFAMAVLQEAHVAVVAGEAFGMPGHIRLSYATSQELLTEAIARIKAFIEKSEKA